ncbi:MAG: helix-turn-helix transcriptional regulator [Myxacorys chilensis ATA2-1-KO14]|jgi:transcriptional regulator with XRE-family HTH domain|nr:helix-turn-helix transcriptional regulator [Myxacorys chilensis ATA2-1-KO14]
MDLMRVTLSVDIPGLGERIRKALDDSKKTPTEVAAASGMSLPNLYRIMSEDTKSVPRETLLRVGEVLEIDFETEIKTAITKEFAD